MSLLAALLIAGGALAARAFLIGSESYADSVYWQADVDGKNLCLQSAVTDSMRTVSKVEFREEDGVNDCMLTLFVKDETRSRRSAEPLYQRFQEQHLQRGYLPEEVRTAVENAGLYFLEMLDTDTGGPVTEMTERVTMAVGDDEARRFTLLEEHAPQVIMLEDHVNGPV